MKTVIFDLDGTLANTAGDLIVAANTCFKGLGYGALLDPVKDQVTAVAGARAMLRLGFQRLGIKDEDLVEQEFPKLVNFYREKINVFTYLYPGAKAGIEKLISNGYAVGICTNKPEALADDLVNKLGIRHLFKSLVGADTLATKKPDAAPYFAAVERAGGRVEQSLLVGDTLTDRDTARAAKVPCLLVTFSPDGQAVKRFDPEGLLDDFSDLQNAVHKLIG